jgi:hypothetical protein
MATWQQRAKEMSKGKWIRFDAEQPEHTVTFTGEPHEVEKTSRIQGKEGETYTVMSFPVEEDNRDMILEPNNSLLRLITEEDSDHDGGIIGLTFRIKCLDLKRKQQWKLREVTGAVQQWGEKKKAKEEEEIEPEPIKEAPEQDEKAKEKFNQEVEKRTKARKPRVKKEPVEEAENEDVRESEEDS